MRDPEKDVKDEEARREVHRQLDDIIRMAQYAPNREELLTWCREEHEQRAKLKRIHKRGRKK